MPMSDAVATLLIVDDDRTLRRLLSATFGLGRYRVHEADNGAAALPLAVELRPDVVLLDVMMPGEIDGLEVCRRIKACAALQHTRVVLLTALGQQKDRELGESAGADAYVVKPFSPKQLIALVDSML